MPAKLPRPSPEWLREKYETERVDGAGVGRLLSINSTTALRWIREAGIKTRDPKLVRPAHEWLRQKYTTELLDASQIARILKCDSKTAWEWIRAAGIETRKRGFGKPSNLFQPGSQMRLGIAHTPESKLKVGAASRARHAVPYLKNGRHWLHEPGVRPPNWKGGITPERQAFYRSPEWKAVARLVWRRDNAQCQRCNLDYRQVDCKTVKFHIHHIVGFAITESRAEPANLVLLCQPCHMWMHRNERASPGWKKAVA